MVPRAVGLVNDLDFVARWAFADVWPDSAKHRPDSFWELDAR
jgi:hypothetical protein